MNSDIIFSNWPAAKDLNPEPHDPKSCALSS